MLSSSTRCSFKNRLFSFHNLSIPKLNAPLNPYVIRYRKDMYFFMEVMPVAIKTYRLFRGWAVNNCRKDLPTF